MNPLTILLPEVEIFVLGQDHQYSAWLDEHPEGWVFNDTREGRALPPDTEWRSGRLHWVSCPTLQGSPAKGESWTTNPKVCSAEYQPIRAWADGHQRLLSLCQKCLRGLRGLQTVILPW